MTIEVSNQEFNTILAALRYYQQHGQGDPDNRSCWIHQIACGERPNLRADVSLDDDGIDELCKRINT